MRPLPPNNILIWQGKNYIAAGVIGLKQHKNKKVDESGIKILFFSFHSTRAVLHKDIRGMFVSL